MKKLIFRNRDARPKTAVIETTAECVPPIMAWYGSHHSGDYYTVTFDGIKVAIDAFGEPVAFMAEDAE